MSDEEIVKKQMEIEKRKAFLDKIMREYYYEKNDIDLTLDFLGHMFREYESLLEKEI